MFCTSCIRVQTSNKTTHHIPLLGRCLACSPGETRGHSLLQPGRPGQSHSRPPPERMRAQLHVNSILLFILGSEIVISTEVNRELGQNVPVQGSHTVKPEILSACVCVGGWYKPSNRI